MRSGLAARAIFTVLALAHTLSAQPRPGSSQPPRIRRFVEAPHPANVPPNAAPVTVVLELSLDDAGRVTTARVLTSGGPAWDEAALAAARDFLFDPVRVNGSSVPSVLRYRYVFAPATSQAADEDAPRAVSTARAAVTPTPPPTPGAAPTPSTAPPTAPADDAQEAVVRSRVRSRETWRRELVAEDLQRMPGTRGDALLAVQNLPGVGRPQFGQGLFIVRGSDPDDTLVTLESQPIGLPFHFYGLATTIATDLIERIEFLPGNFSARWGRISGGVVNVTLRAPARDRVHVVGDVDIIDAGVYASVPLGRRASIAIGARRSYIDAALAVASPDLVGFSRLPRYWDYQLAFDADLGARDSVRVVASGSDDALTLNFATPNSEDPNLRGDSGNAVAYHGAQARWRHRFSPSVHHTFAPSYSITLSDVNVGPEVRYAITTQTVSVRDEFEARLGSHVRLFAGLDVQAGQSEASIVAPPLATNGISDPVQPGRLVRYGDTRTFVNPAGYLEADVTIARRLQLLAGVRLDWFSRSDAWAFNPRASARFELHPRIALRAGVGQYTSQPRGYVILPGFGNPDLRPEAWLHASAGVQMDVIAGALELTSDLFTKFADETAAPSTRLIERDGQRVSERFANTGSARVIGAEWLLRLRPGRVPFFAWLSYTFQQAERRDALGAPWYTSPWDQTHLLTFVAGALLPRGWEVGLRVRYTTGSPEPRVTGALYDSDHDVSLTWVDTLRPGRMPDFFMLDARVAKRFRWGPVAMQVIVEVLNATNQANVESRVYSYDRRSSVPVTGMPIIPNVGLRAEY